VSVEVRSPATGALLGTVADVDLSVASAAARSAQPLWSLVPAAARARYVRRAGIAMLDWLDELALLIAEETGRPRSHVVVSELLPAARGLHALADEGPRALADRRLSGRVAALAGRRTTLVQSPMGVIGLRGPSASPWAEPALEAAAALLAGNGVVLTSDAPLTAQRLRSVFLRAGVPGELLAVVPEASLDAGALDAVCDRVVELPRPTRRGTLIVLEGAPLHAVVDAAVFAAFAGGGRHPAAAGRMIVVEGVAPGLVEALRSAAARLRVGDPRDPETDIGPLAAAEAGERMPGSQVEVPGLAGPFFAPCVLGPVAPDDPLFADPPPGPVLAVAGVPDADGAVTLAARDGRDASISIWAQDAAKGERVARRLPSPATWVGRHGIAEVGVSVRLARHVAPRQLERRAPWAPGAARLPVDPRLVERRAALEEFRHGRESRRGQALRALLRQSRR
jgi:acyl-CoA reductase-like NAD-dependent aldehyde dehydrogenase